MEWTGRQQLDYLLQSVLVGVVVGVVFDVMTECGRAAGRRRTVFWLDGLFGVLAALITFFGALVITDGRLHPLLFFGVLSGMAVEHYSVGRLLARIVCHSLGFVRRLCHLTERGARLVASGVRKVGKRTVCLLKKGKKVAKKGCFFEKKT